MLNKFIYTEKKLWFEINLKTGNIPDEAIVFIEDTKLIWNHGTYFDCSTFDPSEIENALSNKQDIISDLETIRQGSAKGATAVQDVSNKVDKVEGKQLSTEDFTTDLKTRLEGLNVYKKIYRLLSSLPSESSGWYTIAKIDDTESSLFQVSTGGHSDVTFTVSTGWGGNPSGSLTILNSFYSSETGDVNGNHVHVKQVRIRKYDNKLHVDLNLNKPISNTSNYVNIVVSVFTNAGHDLLENELALSDSLGTVVQTFALQNLAIMADKVVTKTITADNLATVATSGNYTDLSNKPESLKNPASLTFGSKTYDGSSAAQILPADLGLSAALKYCGTTTTELTDGSTVTTVTIDSENHTALAGCVVFYGDKEFVFNGTKWEELGFPLDLTAYATVASLSNYKTKQTAVQDPTANGTTTSFIDTISQNENGEIIVTKKSVNFPSAVTETTVTDWGFTKNTGTITGITMNGASKGTNGVVDLGTVLTSHLSLANYYTKSEIDTKLGDINSILESIIGGGNVSIFPIVLTIGDNGQTAIDLYNYVVQNHKSGVYELKENEIVKYNSTIISNFYYSGGNVIIYYIDAETSLIINQSGMVMLNSVAGN